MHFAAAHAVANQPHRIAKAMIGAFCAVFLSGSAKLAHDHDHVARLIDFRAQLRQAARQIAQVVGQLPRCRALVGMGIPAACGQETQPQCGVVAHQRAQMLSIQREAHRIGSAVAGRVHLGLLGGGVGGRAVFV